MDCLSIIIKLNMRRMFFVGKYVMERTSVPVFVSLTVRQHQELKSVGEYPNGNCRSCWNATAPGTSQTEPCPDLPDLAFRTVSNISPIVYTLQGGLVNLYV